MSEPLASSELMEMKARCDAATPGPWESDGEVIGWLGGEAPGVAVWYEHENQPRNHSPICMCQPNRSGKYGVAGTEYPIEDAAIIAHARTDLPRLIEEVERLKVEVKRLTEALVIAKSDQMGEK